jgi:hypothetical protein
MEIHPFTNEGNRAYMRFKFNIEYNDGTFNSNICQEPAKLMESSLI